MECEFIFGRHYWDTRSLLCEEFGKSIIQVVLQAIWAWTSIVIPWLLISISMSTTFDQWLPELQLKVTFLKSYFDQFYPHDFSLFSQQKGMQIYIQIPWISNFYHSHHIEKYYLYQLALISNVFALKFKFHI